MDEFDIPCYIIFAYHSLGASSLGYGHGTDSCFQQLSVPAKMVAPAGLEPDITVV